MNSEVTLVLDSSPTLVVVASIQCTLRRTNSLCRPSYILLLGETELKAEGTLLQSTGCSGSGSGGCDSNRLLLVAQRTGAVPILTIM
jgi:hypothetical protein